MAEVLGPFMSPYSPDEGPYPRSILELRLLALSAAIRRKPDWHFKRLDPEIVARWKEEAIAQHITPTQFQIVFDELECYDKLRSGCIEVADVDGVWKAPGLFPEDLALQFSRLVDHLSNVPDHEKDWHPGSDGKALDLIHPGLYLFVSGKTRTVDVDCDPYTSGGNPTSFSWAGRVPEKPYEFTRTDHYLSSRYQWIPTPIEVDDDKKVRFLSYVNNLHPKRHAQLYHVLAEMLTATIPLFEYVLGFLKEDRHPKIDLSGFEMYDPEWRPPKLEKDESHEAYDGRWWEEYLENRPMLPIPVEKYKPVQQIQPVSLSGRKLQIITKIQEIHLTPDKPSYEGGVWHIEGMENEGIVASAIYYYDCTNITECTLSFREAIREPDYEQNDDRGVDAVYGLLNEGPLVQELGSIVTKSGLVLAWPNMFQHRVSPFELMDKSKPGKRGILVFWLVNPDIPMKYDTSNVPPQQRDWWLEEVEQNATLVSKLPQELRDLIFEYVDDPMPLEMAKQHRLNSMEERKYLQDEHNGDKFEREFSLCEH